MAMYRTHFEYAVYSTQCAGKVLPSARAQGIVGHGSQTVRHGGSKWLGGRLASGSCCRRFAAVCVGGIANPMLTHGANCCRCSAALAGAFFHHPPSNSSMGLLATRQPGGGRRDSDQTQGGGNILPSAQARGNVGCGSQTAERWQRLAWGQACEQQRVSRSPRFCCQ